MLQLFYVFSNITARVVSRVIEHLELSQDEILIVLDRSIIPTGFPLDFRIEPLGFKPYQRLWPHVSANWQCIRANSARIRNLTDNKNYIAYIPSSSDATCQQIIHHPACKQFFLIEEGLASYCPPGAKPIRMPSETWQWRLRQIVKGSICGLGRIRPIFTDFPIWKKKYRGCFGSSDLTFPKFPEIVINLKRPLYQPVISPITRLVIFDDFSVFSPKLQAVYLDVIRQVISLEHSKGDHWGYKLHPRCAAWPALVESARKAFSDSLPSDAQYEALAPDTCAEDIGISLTVTTYGYISSCLFYIHQCGGKVCSFKHLLEKRNSAFRALWSRIIPPILDDLVGNYPMLDDKKIDACNP